MSFFSGLRVLFTERRLPYRAQRHWDHVCKSLGRRETSLAEGPFTFRVRRLSCDVDFVHNIVKNREYLPEGITIRPDDTVIDIGGNIGTFAVLASSLAARVVTVEPEPSNLSLLRRNLRLNPGCQVQVIDAAVAESGGVLSLRRAAEGGFHTVVEGRPALTIDSIQVRAMTLSQVFDESGVTSCGYLKLDCEGAEWGILESSPAELWKRVSQIGMEYHVSSAADQRRRQEEWLLHWARENGFAVVHWRPFTSHPCGHLFLSRRVTAPHDVSAASCVSQAAS